MPESAPNNDDEAPAGKSVVDRLQTLVGILLAAVASYSAWQLNAAEKSVKEMERSLMARESARKDSEIDRANRESSEKKQLLVYDAVVKSLDGGDPRKQQVSKALVTSMLEDPLRTELLAVLTESGTPEIRKQAQVTLALESTFKAEEGATRLQPSKDSVATKSADKAKDRSPPPKQQSAPSRWADWSFDIFWCERSGKFAQEKAQAIEKQLRVEGANGRLRVRLLPDSINARPGYQHNGYVIRYNLGEESMSGQLKSFADEVVGSNVSFLETISHQPTGRYLSAFVCPLRT